MSLSIGIVGLPNVGKSTLFNALTKNDILAANYPFATIEPNTGIVPIPDERLVSLAGLYDSAKITPAVIKFVDIAGLVAGASKGEGLGNQFLSHIREVDAILMVIRVFKSADVKHVENSVHPQRDVAIILTELVLADLQTVNKRLPTLDKESQSNTKLKADVELLIRAKELLDADQALNRHPDFVNKAIQSDNFRQLQLLTIKPIIHVFNVDEADLTDMNKQHELNKYIVQDKALYVNADMESELKDLPENEAKELLKSVGVDEPGLDKLAKTAYSTLGLQSFLTAGPKEVRAWTISAGSTAWQAAGVIHGDFQRGFIAADVVDLNDLVAAGTWPQARAHGKVKTEGKTYIMQPNDVVEFKFNV
ncbi:MAG TPA: redox-regulated ATPase YchF [Candidatus Saccharimonadales bacterium]